jgi:hypothetical protein
MKEILIKKPESDMTPDIFRVLENCAENTVIKFPEGEYHFYPEFAFEKYYYISNNRHGLKRVAFPIIGKKNLTIDGGGSRFVFHGEIIPFVIENSEGIVLKNFSIDWERPFYSQGVITSADETGVTLEIDRKRYPYHFKNGEMIFDGEGWARSFSEGIFEIDPVTHGPAYLSGDAMGLGITKDLGVEEISDGVIRFNKKFPHIPKIGNILLLRHYRRCCPGIHLKLSRDTRLEHVTLHHAGGMGVIAQFCENITLSGCRVTPSAGRHFSVTVDATHFVNCRGQITLKDCLFEGQLDDPANIHGLNVRVKKILDRRTVVAELVHHEQHGVEIGCAGDRMNLADNATLLSYAENTVEKVDWINARYSRIAFAQDLSEELREGHVLENMSRTPDLHITGCTCRNNRARGYLITTPGKVIVENNRIESSGAGIKISGDANHWFESGAVRDVLIRNNEFGDCCYGPKPWGRTVIDIDPEIPHPWKISECFHRNIRIENNRFCTFDIGILFARSVDGITFSGNTVRRTKSYPMVRRMNELLTFEACRNIRVQENDIDSSISEKLFLGVKQGTLTHG